MAIPVPHLLLLVLLAVSALLIADWLLSQRRVRVARRRRLERRIAELGRERQTLHTRSDAP